jgi:hypothetical protein
VVAAFHTDTVADGVTIYLERFQWPSWLVVILDQIRVPNEAIRALVLLTVAFRGAQAQRLAGQTSRCLQRFKFPCLYQREKRKRVALVYESKGAQKKQFPALMLPSYWWARRADVVDNTVTSRDVVEAVVAWVLECGFDALLASHRRPASTVHIELWCKGPTNMPCATVPAGS